MKLTKKSQRYIWKERKIKYYEKLFFNVWFIIENIKKVNII